MMSLVLRFVVNGIESVFYLLFPVGNNGDSNRKFWITLVVYILFYLISSSIWGYIVSSVVGNKGYSSKTKRKWFWIGFFFNEFALGFAVIEPDSYKEYFKRMIKEQEEAKKEAEPKKIVKAVPKENEWGCACGRANPNYVTTCLCGRAKENSFFDEIVEKEQKPTLKE